jgi:hypothetical protein
MLWVAELMSAAPLAKMLEVLVDSLVDSSEAWSALGC